MIEADEIVRVAGAGGPEAYLARPGLAAMARGRATSCEPRKFRETFTVASWTEHLRQHEDRLTGTDRGIVAAAKQLATAEPVVEHLFPARTPVIRRGT
jgi:hypothetical protein